MSTSEKGIVVLGSPRSGTTLMRRLLNAHPRIACPGETCMLSACARFLHTETVSDGLEFGVLNGLSFAGFDRDEILSRLREFAFGFHKDYAASQGKARWAEKTAVDIFHLPNVELLCGDDVQYICIARHGLDVICSLKDFSDRGFTYLTEIHEYVKQYPRVLEAFAHAWVDANQALLGLLARRPEQTLLLRYEDLVENADEQLGDLFEFLGEERGEALVDEAMKRTRSTGLGDWKSYSRSGIDTASVSRWSALPSGIVSQLGQICNPTLIALGYDEIPYQEPDSQDVARRRYEFSLAFGATKSDK